MSQAKYSNNYFILIPEYEKSLRDYLKDHPFTKSDIDNVKQSYADLKGLSDVKNKDIDENFEDYMILGFLMGHQMALPMPAYAPLMKTCENLEYYDSCIAIAKILKDNSTIMIAESIGYALELKLLEHSEDQNTYLIVKQNYDKLRDGYKCIGQTQFNENNAFPYDLDYFHNLNKVWREKGELAAFTEMAMDNYKKQLALGNKMAVDPKTCF